MVEEPKPKKSGRRRRSSLNAPLTIKEKKARKSAQDMLREKKHELEKAQKNFWATKNKLKELDEVFDGKKQVIEENKIEEASPNIQAALKDKDVAAVFKKHAMITGEEFNMSKLTNFDKLFTLYSINLLDKTYANLQAVDEQSQYAYLTEQKKLTEEKIEEIQSGITLD